MTAWQMYAHDNQDKLVVVLQGAGGIGGLGDPVYGVGWVSGWLDWSARADNTNANYLIDPRYAKLAPYVNQGTSLFKCPADTYLSGVQKAMGWSRRVRSYSAQIGVGAGNPQAGPWDPLYRHVTNTSGLLYPTPGETTVLVEEHPDSMNDPALFPPYQTEWIDPPATYHNGGCTFGFADGHSELHRWTGSLTSARARQVHATDGDYINATIVARTGDPDIHWMSFHTQRVSTNSY
jgi:prepilin-type processing-associated H-X9-DG protein